MPKGGLGIGLTLVKDLVEMHCGTIEAASPGRGAGQHVHDSIAGAERGSSAAADCLTDLRSKRRVHAALPCLGGRRQRRRRRDAGKIASSDESMWFARPTMVWQAWRRPCSAGPEVVLLDIGMPGIDGYETARRLRELPEMHSAVLVAVTGWGQDEDRQQSRDAGFNCHLVKPVSREALQAVLASRISV